MKGNPEVIKHLNSLLAGELTAADLYFIQSCVFKDWGLDKLAEQFKHEMSDELGHAEMLIDRILFLEGVPNLAGREELETKDNVADMLKYDLELEYGVIAALKEVIAYCESCGDYQSREILGVLLKDTEEDHTFMLETQIGLIDKMGLENYIQSKT